MTDRQALSAKLESLYREMGTVGSVIGRKCELTTDDLAQVQMVGKWQASVCDAVLELRRLDALPSIPDTRAWQPIETADGRDVGGIQRATCLAPARERVFANPCTDFLDMLHEAITSLSSPSSIKTPCPSIPDTPGERIIPIPREALLDDPFDALHDGERELEAEVIALRQQIREAEDRLIAAVRKIVPDNAMKCCPYCGAAIKKAAPNAQPETPVPAGTEPSPLDRYGIRWAGPKEPIAEPMPDGYWTPWHIANDQLVAARKRLALLTAGVQQIEQAMTKWIGTPKPRKGLDEVVQIWRDRLHALTDSQK